MLNKIKRYKGETLKDVLVSYKIDGVRLHVDNSEYKSRANKPLYNLPEGLEDGIYEIYRNNFKETINVVRASKSDRTQIDKSEIYKLFPELDPRLQAVKLTTANKEDIKYWFEVATSLGYEGLVLRTDNQLYKVKNIKTIDLKVLDIVEGKGKHTGRTGALITEKGKVGTGLTDKDRELFTKDYIVGKYIEVGYMEETEEGKLRHPRFIKVREDLYG